jgi:hypothetical protein
MIIWETKSQRKKLMGHAAYMGQMKNESKNLARKPLGKKPLAKPKHRLE